MVTRQNPLPCLSHSRAPRPLLTFRRHAPTALTRCPKGTPAHCVATTGFTAERYARVKDAVCVCLSLFLVNEFAARPGPRREAQVIDEVQQQRSNGCTRTERHFTPRTTIILHARILMTTLPARMTRPVTHGGRSRYCVSLRAARIILFIYKQQHCVY